MLSVMGAIHIIKKLQGLVTSVFLFSAQNVVEYHLICKSNL